MEIINLIFFGFNELIKKNANEKRDIFIIIRMSQRDYSFLRFLFYCIIYLIDHHFCFVDHILVCTSIDYSPNLPRLRSRLLLFSSSLSSYLFILNYFI